MSIQVAFGLSKLDQKRAPASLLLLRDGDLGWEGLDACLTPAMAEKIMRGFVSHGSQLPVDYHHATLKAEQGKVAQAPAAGFITDLRYEPGRGLFGDVEWNADAERQIEAREFKYTSPVITYDDVDGEVDIYGLHSVALTNRPRTRDQEELMEAAERLATEIDAMGTTKAKAKPKLKKVSPGVALYERTIAAEEDVDNFPAVDKNQSLMAKVIGQLQESGSTLADDAPLSDVLAAVLEHLGADVVEDDTGTENVDETDATEAAERKGDKTMTAEQAEQKLKAAAYDGLNTRLKTLEGERSANRVQTLIDEQIDSGKLMPDNAEQIKAAKVWAAENEDGFKKFYDAMTPIAEPGSVVRGPSSAKPKSAGGGRQGLIAAASLEYDDNPNVAAAHGVKRIHYVSSSLSLEGHPKLTETEIKKLED